VDAVTWKRIRADGDSVDNPPPKVVQGYKFNIFYPDLMYVQIYTNFMFQGADVTVFR
jgi:hypothetical protein